MQPEVIYTHEILDYLVCHLFVYVVVLECAIAAVYLCFNVS